MKTIYKMQMELNTLPLLCLLRPRQANDLFYQVYFWDGEFFFSWMNIYFRICKAFWFNVIMSYVWSGRGKTDFIYFYLAS